MRVVATNAEGLAVCAGGVEVMTDLVGGDAAYSLIAQISAAVWSAETA